MPQTQGKNSACKTFTTLQPRPSNPYRPAAAGIPAAAPRRRCANATMRAARRNDILHVQASGRAACKCAAKPALWRADSDFREGWPKKQAQGTEFMGAAMIATQCIENKCVFSIPTQYGAMPGGITSRGRRRPEGIEFSSNPYMDENHALWGPISALLTVAQPLSVRGRHAGGTGVATVPARARREADAGRAGGKIGGMALPRLAEIWALAANVSYKHKTEYLL